MVQLMMMIFARRSYSSVIVYEVRRIHHAAREASLQHAEHISQNSVRSRRNDEAKVRWQLGKIIHKNLKSLVADRFDADACCLEIGALLLWRVATLSFMMSVDTTCKSRVG